MNDWIVPLAIVGIAVVIVMAILFLSRAKARVEEAIPQGEEAAALLAYHALISSLASAEQDVTAAITRRDQIAARIAKFRATVAQ